VRKHEGGKERKQALEKKPERKRKERRGFGRTSVSPQGGDEEEAVSNRGMKSETCPSTSSGERTLRLTKRSRIKAVETK